VGLKLCWWEDDAPCVGLGGPPLPPPPLDQGDEKVDEAGDLLAFITPGRRKLEGELGPAERATKPLLPPDERWFGLR